MEHQPMSDPHRPGERLPAPPVAPAARDRVVEVLTRHFAEDRISAEDLEARLERVYHATTGAELETVIADLPAALPVKAASAVPATDAAPQRIRALLSGQEQRVSGVVPGRLEVWSRLGYVELDLTSATFGPGVTEIDVRAFMGYVQIRFPVGVRVESRGHAIVGFFSLKGRPEPSEDATGPVVRVTGRAMFGFAECYLGKRRKQLRRPDADE
jgi:DUF1707 SHOCT-like domain